MTGESINKTKRVSFAAEHQINYIYQGEYNNTKSSSSIGEAGLDFTTEIAELKNLSLFEKPKETFLEENIEKLFMENDTIAYKEDPILVKQYNKRRKSIARKMSLDPLNSEFENKENTNNEEIANMSNENSFNDTAILNSSYMVEELINTVDLRNIVHYEKKKNVGLIEFLHNAGIRFLDDSIVDATRRDTLSKSYNVVDEALINYYKYSMKERIEFFNMFSGFLASKTNELQEEINKLEEALDVNNLNKDMMKKIRSESRNRAKVSWYVLRKTYEMQFNRKMQSNKIMLQEVLNGKRKEVDKNDEIIKSKLENIKLLHEKCKLVEEDIKRADIEKSIDFDKEDNNDINIIDNDGFFEDINEKNNGKDINSFNNLNKIKNSINENGTTKKINSIYNFNMIKNSINENGTTENRNGFNNLKNIKGLSEAEKLLEMINERKKLLEELEDEHSGEKRNMDEKRIEENILMKSIEKLRMENENLRRNIMVSTVTENVFEKTKKMFQRYCNLFKLKVLKLSFSAFHFEIFSCEIIFELNNTLEVTKCKINNKYKIEFYDLIEFDDISNIFFPDFIKTLLSRFILIDAIKNEYEMLKDKYIAECFYLKQHVYMRFINHEENRILDLNLNDQGDLIWQGNLLGNMNNDIGLLKSVICEKY